MAEKIILTTDTMVDIPIEWVQEFNIKRIPTIIYFGGEQMDAREINAHDVLEYYKEHKELPETGPTTVEMFNSFFVPLIHQGYKIIHLSTMPSISQNYANSLEVQECYSAQITVIDTKFSSIGTAPLIWELGNYVKNENPTYQQIIDKAKQVIDKIYCGFIVDDINFVLENRNVSALSIFIARAINLKPSMRLTDGKIIPDKKFNGSTKKALNKFIEYTFKNKNIDNKLLMLGHTDADEEVINEAKSLISKYVQFEKVEVICAGGPISSHLGKGAIMVSYLTK